MEIEVGDYVRIKHMYDETKIAKIKAILSKDPCYKDMQMYEIDVVHQRSNGHFKSYKIYEEDIIKHNKNIIDLIEEGDYVNRMLVVNIIQFSDEICSCFKQVLVNRDEKCTLPPLRISENEIKSIVTKEQFSQMEYNLEE